MWNSVARFIIKNRLSLIILIGLITLFMGYHASNVQMSYDANRTVPQKDPDMIVLNRFRAQFGEDGNVIAVGLQDSSVYQLKNFEAYRDLARNVKQIAGINEVISLPVTKIILKDTEKQRFYLANIFPETIRSQEELDSLIKLTLTQKGYVNQFVNAENGATMMPVFVHKDVMNSSLRDAMTASLLEEGRKFEEKTGIKLHYAGLPFIRAVVAQQVRR